MAAEVRCYTAFKTLDYGNCSAVQATTSLVTVKAFCSNAEDKASRPVFQGLKKLCTNTMLLLIPREPMQAVSTVAAIRFVLGQWCDDAIQTAPRDRQGCLLEMFLWERDNSPHPLASEAFQEGADSSATGTFLTEFKSRSNAVNFMLNHSLLSEALYSPGSTNPQRRKRY